MKKKYKIEIKKSAIKVLRRLPRDDQIRIARSIQSLSDRPRPHNCTKLADSPYYRIRCGSYRIIYEIRDDRLIIVILKIGHRRDVYKK